MPRPTFTTARLRLRPLEPRDAKALIEPGNAASRGLVEKLGFAAEGLLRDRLCVEGKYRSVLIYALLAEDWHARHPKPKSARAVRAKR